MSLRAFDTFSIGGMALHALAIGACVVSMPVVAKADDTLGQFIEAIEKTKDDGAFFKRVFGAKKSVRREVPTVNTANARDTYAVIVADADTDFAHRQRDADERLKEEQAKSTPTLHPLAAAHPTKSVVICEAGCGATTIDEIVYFEPAVAAALPVTPAGDADGRLSSDIADPAAANLADGELPCIAGCYAHNAGGERAAHADQVLIDEGRTSRGANETAIVLTATSASDFYKGWRTEIVRTRATRSELPRRVWQRQSFRYDPTLGN